MIDTRCLKAYKLVRVVEDRLISVIVRSAAVQHIYRPREWTEFEYPAFLFDTFERAREFGMSMDMYVPLEVWLCEIRDIWPIPYSGRILPTPFSRKGVREYWEGKIKFSSLVYPPRGTILARKVKPIRKRATISYGITRGTT